MQPFVIANEIFYYLKPNNKNRPFIVVQNKMPLLHGYHANPGPQERLLGQTKEKKERLCPERGHWCWVRPGQHRTLCLSHYNIAIVADRDDKAENHQGIQDGCLLCIIM